MRSKLYTRQLTARECRLLMFALDYLQDNLEDVESEEVVGELGRLPTRQELLGLIDKLDPKREGES